MSRARTFADLATASEAGNLNTANLVINGDMAVAQRATSSTSTGYQTVDRFQMGTSGVDEGPTQAQVDVSSGTTPYTLGFKKALRITNGNQTGGADAGDIIDVKHGIEAQHIAASGWNFKSSSSFLTLSFWVKSSVAQNFFGLIRTFDGTSYNFPFSTGSLTADTWTKVTKKIPGNSNLTINTDNGEGLQIRWHMFLGTDRTTSLTEETWVAFNTNQRTPANTSTWYTTNDATFEITGVQLEVGEVATPFKHESYGDNLARCQRYYFQVGKFPSSSGYGVLGTFAAADTSSGFTLVDFPVYMRTEPTFSHSGTASDYSLYITNSHKAGSGGFSASSGDILKHMYVYTEHSGGITAGDAGHLTTNNNNTDAFLGFSAEL